MIISVSSGFEMSKLYARLCESIKDEMHGMLVA